MIRKRLHHYREHLFVLCMLGALFLVPSLRAFGQFEILDYLEKPKGMEKKKITSERSPYKKFGAFRAFTQNNFTYYNFYFNANDRFEDLIKEARRIQLEKFIKDFELSWGDENEEYMSANRFALDTIIAKCKAGVLLHDLRNKWTDDLLLLMGKCYYYTHRYDTAFTFFQYVNNAYKTGEGYDESTIYLDETKHQYSIASPEPAHGRNPIARNDALLWIPRTLSAMGETESAFAIINILNNDAYFPKRLSQELLHVKAFAHYQKKEYALAASTLEQMYSDLFSKKKINNIATARMLLVAHTYQQGYRYHDAFKFFQQVAEKTRNPHIAMNALIERIGLDYVNQIHLQIEDIIQNKKFRKYAPEMYLKLARKTFELRDLYPFPTIGEKAFALNDLFSNDEKRELRLMLISYYLAKENYEKASSFLDADMAKSITSKEEKQYDLYSIAGLQRLALKKNAIDTYDSLLRLSNLPEAQLIAAIKKITSKKKQTRSKDNAPSKTTNESPQTETSSWYFDNDYIVIKGKQEFESKFGQIRNADMWRNQPIASLSNSTTPTEATTSKTTTDHLRDEVQQFIQKIPTVPSKKAAMNDSLFYTLADYAITILNYFPNPKQAKPYVARALSMKISDQAAQSEKMNSLKKIARLSFTDSTQQPLPLASKKPPATPPNVETFSNAYQEIVDDYFARRWDKFLSNGYPSNALSPKEIQRLDFMTASVYLKSEQKEQGKKILLALQRNTRLEETMAKKVRELLSLLN